MTQSLKILIIRFSSLGDIILTTPVFRELKKIYPESHLTFLTSEEFGGMVANNPYIDQIIYHVRQESWQELNQLIQSLQKLSFDLIYDIHRSLRSRWICWKLQRNFFKKQPALWKINKNGWKRTLLVHWKINMLKHSISQREIYLKPLQSHTSQLLDSSTELFPSEEDKTQIQAILKKNQLIPKKFICIGPSASFPGKCWPLEHYQALISCLLEQKWDVVLVGGKKEEEPQHLKQIFGNRIHNMAGETRLLESASLLDSAALVVSNDTSIAHMAEAMGVPILTIFGPTVREFGYAPFLKQSVLIEQDLPCRPCTRNGKGECKIAQKRLCLTSITPQSVYAQVQHILKHLSAI